MSKEAKVGLLLGLVFIVAIAVVLRGVHQNSIGAFDESKQISQATKDDKLDIEVPLPLTPSHDNWPGRHHQPVPEPEVSRDDPVVPEHADTTGYQPRFIMPLPGNGSPNPYQPTDWVPDNINGTDIGPLRPDDSPAMRDDRHKPIDPIDVINEMPEPVVSRKAKRHVVRKGENLSKIAVKYYGATEGNRMVNIKRIFEANRKVMHSIDDVQIGWKLSIPPLPDSKGLAVGGSADKARKTVPNTGSSGRFYVVKTDDSLWGIAANKLGNGARYKEIVRLNKNKIGDEKRLQVGTKLRLP